MRYEARDERTPSQIAIRKQSTETLDREDFPGESRREARKIAGRAVSLSKVIAAYLKVKTRRMIRELTKEIRNTGKILKVRKASARTPEEKRLLRLLSYYGLRQITDSGREFAGSEWLIPGAFVSEYLSQKEILIQQLDANIEKEFRQAVGRALSSWMREDPSPTIGQISERLRRWSTTSSKEELPMKLKPLGNRFTEEGLGARARMIARTEINGARNYGRFEAGKLLGRTHLIWLALDDQKTGRRRHDALDGQIRRIGTPFKNPITGSELLYPGDPKTKAKFKQRGKVVSSPHGAAGEIINCRCSVRPITARMAQRLRGRK